MPGILAQAKSQENDGWTFNLRGYMDSESDDSDTETKKWTSGRFLTDSQLAEELDLSTREDTVKFAKNPWNTAKLNAKSQTSKRQPESKPTELAKVPTKRNHIMEAFRNHRPRQHTNTPTESKDKINVSEGVKTSYAVTEEATPLRRRAVGTESLATKTTRQSGVNAANQLLGPSVKGTISSLYTGVGDSRQRPSLRDKGSPSYPLLSAKEEHRSHPSYYGSGASGESPISANLPNQTGVSQNNPTADSPSTALRPLSAMQSPASIRAIMDAIAMKTSPQNIGTPAYSTPLRARHQRVPEPCFASSPISIRRNPPSDSLVMPNEQTLPKYLPVEDMTHRFPSSDLTLVGSSPAATPNSKKYPIPLKPSPPLFSSPNTSTPPRRSSLLVKTVSNRDAYSAINDGEDVEWPTFRPRPKFTKSKRNGVSKAKALPHSISGFKHTVPPRNPNNVRITTHKLPSRGKLTVYHPPPKPEAKVAQNSVTPERPFTLVRAGDKLTLDEQRLQRLLGTPRRQDIVDLQDSDKAGPKENIPRRYEASSPSPRESRTPPTPTAPYDAAHLTKTYPHARLALSERQAAATKAWDSLDMDSCGVVWRDNWKSTNPEIAIMVWKGNFDSSGIT